VVDERFDTTGDTFDLAELDKTVGAYFSDRDPNVGFAADSVMRLTV
jgi:3-oxoacyl-[acyl-carrier protein] reductase